ncbi:MAG: hypothetical protein HYZ51_04220 [Candidatus Doudnabacteria bacterium]|nr:hypothetical protein [Candidatus Doudnabacteria bacterium]
MTNDKPEQPKENPLIKEEKEKGDDLTSQLNKQQDEIDWMRYILYGVVFVFLLAFLSIAFAYVEFVITQSSNRVERENTLIDKITEQNAKLDIIFLQQTNGTKGR